MYLERLAKYQNYIGIEFYEPEWTRRPTSGDAGPYILQSSVGAVSVDEDSAVEEAAFLLVCLPKNSAENDFFYASCVAAISVLENGKNMDDGLQIMEEEMDPKMDEALRQSMERGDSDTVYSGNYYYSLLSMELDEVKGVFLKAEARREE